MTFCGSVRVLLQSSNRPWCRMTVRNRYALRPLLSAYHSELSLCHLQWIWVQGKHSISHIDKNEEPAIREAMECCTFDLVVCSRKSLLRSFSSERSDQKDREHKGSYSSNLGAIFSVLILYTNHRMILPYRLVQARRIQM